LRRAAGFATLTRLRVVRRVDGAGLRFAPEDGFFAFRLMPVALFFER
jgi:hypothetical protein